MTDTNVTLLHSTPAKGEGRPKVKDPTGPLRSRRARQKRKAVTAAKTKAGSVFAAPARSAVSTAFFQQHGENENPNEIKPDDTVAVRALHATDVTAYIAAIALAGAAAWFSIRGMVVLFPGSPMSVIGMAVAMECAKLVTAGWLARRWRATAWIWRFVLAVLVAGLAIINAAGVYAQLVAAHVGDRGAATSALETQDAALAARIEVAAYVVDDLDRRLGQIDTTIEAAAKRGKTSTALSAIESQKKTRAGLAGERNEAAGALAALKAERAQVAAKGRQAESEAAPIRYVAELIGVDTDSERAIRWLIALMVLCCDPLAVALTAAASARR